VAAALVLALLLGWLVWYGLGHRPPVREGEPNWSPDSQQIVFSATLPGAKADVWIMNADGTHAHAVVETPFDEGAPAFSPDGKQIAFHTDRDGDSEIYVMNVDGTEPRRLTHDPARDESPAWSHDGKRIAFMSNRDGRPEFDIYVMNADGSGVERATTEGLSWYPQFSLDDQQLLFQGGLGRDVHILDFATRRVLRLTTNPQNGMYPTWSGDGSQIAFMTGRDGRQEIFTMNRDGSDQQPLVTMPTANAREPRWSPDGARIVFVQVPDETPQAGQATGQYRAIYTVELRTGKVLRLSR
jgi:TolB protein